MPVNDIRGDRICQTEISTAAPFTLAGPLYPFSDSFQKRFASNEATLFSLPFPLLLSSLPRDS